MNYLIKLSLLLFISFSGHANAADRTLDYPYPIKDGDVIYMPQVFLFNKSGELILKTSEIYPGLKRALTFTTPVNNSEQHKQKLIKGLGLDDDFSGYDFTLFYIIKDDYLESCPPCVKQEKMINQLQKKLQGTTNIQVNKVYLRYFEGSE